MNSRTPATRLSLVSSADSATCLFLIGVLTAMLFPLRIDAQPAMNLPATAIAPRPPAQARGFFQRLAEGVAGRDRSLGRSQRVRHAEEVSYSEIAPVEARRVAPRAIAPRKQPSAKPVTQTLRKTPKPARPQPSPPTVPEVPQFLGETSFSALLERGTLYESGPEPLAAAPSVPTPDANAEPAMPAATPEAEPPPFAKPVPGKKNMVYPPGVEESRENIVDVGGIAPGETTRDPRTGKLFRVP